MSRSPMTEIPSEPSDDVLIAMARRAYPGFDSVTDLDGNVVGMSDDDRAKLLSTMRGVYSVVLKAGSGMPTDSIDHGAVETDGEWKHSDWLQGLSSNGLNAMLQHFNDIDPIHWRTASELSAAPGFPVVMRNDRIAPMLAERVEEEGQTGFLPYVAGLDADGIRWHIDDGKLARWELVRVPGSARGWVELFCSNADDSRERAVAVAPLFAKLKALALSGAEDAEVLAAIETLFEALKAR